MCRVVGGRLRVEWVGEGRGGRASFASSISSASTLSSESSCSCTDVGSPTGGGPKEATAWDSLCTEWNSDKIVVTGPEENANPSMRQDALATPTYELFVDAEQRGLWCALIVHRTSSMLM